MASSSSTKSRALSGDVSKGYGLQSSEGFFPSTSASCTGTAQLGLSIKAPPLDFSHSMASWFWKGAFQEEESQEEHSDSKCSKTTGQKLHGVLWSSLGSHIKYFYPTLWIEAVTNPLRIKGRAYRPHFPMGDVSKTLRPYFEIIMLFNLLFWVENLMPRAIATILQPWGKSQENYNDTSPGDIKLPNHS